MRYKFFYLKEEAKVSGMELKTGVSYRLSEANYDEVMSLCRDRKAVVTYRKVIPNPEPVRSHTVREKKKDAHKEPKKKKEEELEL